MKMKIIKYCKILKIPIPLFLILMRQKIRPVPKFSAKSADKYFPQFEKVEEHFIRSRQFWPTLLQCALISRATEV